MRSHARTALVTATAATALVLPVGAWARGADAGSSAEPHSDVQPGSCTVGDAFARTELFFGLSRPNGRITNAQFERFVDHEVTPRFPDGLTLIKADGQFKDSSGSTIEERSRLLILLHPGDPESSIAIDAIRDEYKSQFDQQSVLRTDSESCTSF